MFKEKDRKILESDATTMHPLISWRSIAAGLLVSVFIMFGLTGLGLAFGGVGLDADTTAMAAGIFSGIWFLVSVLISLFVGSYFAARMSKFQTARIGSAQGIIIASLLLGFMLYQSVILVGALGSAAGSAIGKSAGAIASGAQQAANNPAITTAVNDMAEQALSELNLRSEPSVVAQGVAIRLINGNTEGAKNYLAREAGISPGEANTRLTQLNAEVQRRMDEAKVAAAKALQSTGWTLFLLVVLGGASAIGGGALGSRANFRKPLSTSQAVVEERFQHA